MESKIHRSSRSSLDWDLSLHEGKEAKAARESKRSPVLRGGPVRRLQPLAGPAVTARKPREHKGSLPSQVEVRKAVELFCVTGITDEAANCLKRLVVRHSHPQSGGRRISPPQLEAIAGPFIANFERMSAASSRGPGVFSQVITEVEAALGGGDAAIDQIAGPLLDMIPPSAALNRSERIALPSAMVQAALGGLDATQVPDRGLQLLRQRLYQAANWGECADWIASLFRGAIRALQPDTVTGAALARLELRHFIDSQATRMPPAALAPAVFGMLEGLASATALDTREQAMSLVRELQDRLTPVQLGALCHGVVRHLCVPARSHLKTVQWLVGHAASAALSRQQQLAIGVAVASQLDSHDLMVRLQSDKSQAARSGALADSDEPDPWLALGLRVGGEPHLILGTDLPSRERADLLVLAWQVEASDGRAPACPDLTAIATANLSLDDLAGALARVLPLCQGYPSPQLLAAARDGLLAKAFAPRSRTADCKAQDEPPPQIAPGPPESSAAAALRDEAVLRSALEALYQPIVQATAQLQAGRRQALADAPAVGAASVGAMLAMVNAELEWADGAVVQGQGPERPLDAYPGLKRDVVGWLNGYRAAVAAAADGDEDPPAPKDKADRPAAGPLQQLGSLLYAWWSR